MIIAQCLLYRFPTDDRLCVARQQHLCILRLHGFQHPYPAVHIAVLSAADRVQIRPGRIIIVPAAQDLPLRQPDKKLIVRLAGSCGQYDVHTVDGQFQPFLSEETLRLTHTLLAVDIIERPDADGDHFLRREPHAKLPSAAPSKDVAHQLTAAQLRETGRTGDDLTVIVHQRPCAASMVKMMIMGIDQCLDRFIRDPAKIRQRLLGHLAAIERIHQNAALLPNDQRSIAAAVTGGKIHLIIDADDLPLEGSRSGNEFFLACKSGHEQSSLKPLFY